jgi:PleD family two-component response regulator
MSTVIIVDDSEIELGIFTEALIAAGHDCVGLADPTNALTTIVEKKPDFVILDYSMPHKNGLELCKDLKMNPATRDIPIMFLSSEADPDNIIATMHLGCIDYIRKPVESKKLVDLIMRHDVALKLKEAMCALSPMKEEAQRILDKYDRRSAKKV